MHLERRHFLKAGLTLAGILALPGQLFAARPDAAFNSTATEDAINALFGTSEVSDSDAVVLSAPDIAENGAVVPIGVSTELENVESIAVFVDGNPNPLVASFEIGPNSVADVSTRIKMGKTSLVRAVVKADGKIYGSQKEVKVTIGGCGG